MFFFLLRKNVEALVYDGIRIRDKKQLMFAYKKAFNSKLNLVGIWKEKEFTNHLLCPTKNMIRVNLIKLTSYSIEKQPHLIPYPFTMLLKIIAETIANRIKVIHLDVMSPN
jgi:hypothetical protein